jgi:hypothetical protein
MCAVHTNSTPRVVITFNRHTYSTVYLGTYMTSFNTRLPTRELLSTSPALLNNQNRPVLGQRASSKMSDFEVSKIDHANHVLLVRKMTPSLPRWLHFSPCWSYRPLEGR